jgi:hypothetical protein
MTEKTIQAFAALRTIPSLSKGKEAPNFKVVQEYLQRFGYLRPRDYRENQLDTITALALTRYQQLHGLEPSGSFDEATRAQMTEHRCGVPDLNSGVAFSVTCKWPRPCLTFAFEDGTSDVTGSGEFQAVRNAFATWAAAVPFTFTEVTTSQNPDIVIDWRPAEDADLSMVGGVLAHAEYPPGCGFIDNNLPRPLHFDDSEHAWVRGAVVGSYDIETVALHEIGHLLGLLHSSVAGSVMFASVSSDFTRHALTNDDLSGIRELYPERLLGAGTFTIRQKSSGRFLDAHEIADKDFALVTRTNQNNDTQRWTLKPIGTVFMIRQKSSGRFLDAHDTSVNDFRLVTRAAQTDDSQRWISMPQADGSVTLRQLSNLRFADAHEIADKDFALVTRAEQNNDTQRWTLTSIGANIFTIRQVSSGRFADAHEDSGHDFSVVSRAAQDNDTQRWIFAPVGVVCTLQQKSNGRFVDAHEVADKDFATVSRPDQQNDTQRWIVTPDASGSFTIRQLSNGRFLDAHESDTNDFGVVTRTAQNNDTQRWLIDAV